VSLKSKFCLKNGNQNKMSASTSVRLEQLMSHLGHCGSNDQGAVGERDELALLGNQGVTKQ
jgi:hypothetical protein